MADYDYRGQAASAARRHESQSDDTREPLARGALCVLSTTAVRLGTVASGMQTRSRTPGRALARSRPTMH